MGTLRVVWWLRLQASNASFHPWSGNWIPHVTTEDSAYCNKVTRQPYIYKYIYMEIYIYKYIYILHIYTYIYKYIYVNL